MATAIPKYVQNKDVWNKLVKPEWVGSFSGGGANPVRLDLKNGKVFSAADVSSIPESEKPYVLVNKRYVDGELVNKAGKAEFDALQSFTTTQLAVLGAQVGTVPDVEWDDVTDKPKWTSDFEGGDTTHVVVGNSINMSDNIIYGLPKPLSGVEYRKQATNREYVDDSIAASDVIMNQAIEDKADVIMADLAPVLDNLKYPEYDNVKNVPAHIQWMTWTDLPGQTDIPIKMLMPLDMNQKEILNVPQPVSLDNAANKGYVDESVATRLAITEFDQTISNYPTTAEMEKHVLDYTTNASVTGFWTKVTDAIAASASAATWTSVEKTGPAWLKTVLTVPRSGIQGDLDTLTQIQGGLDMGGARIQNLSEPLNDNDAVPYNFFRNALTSSANPKLVYDAATAKLDATANLNMNSYVVQGLKTVDPSDPAKVYVPKSDEAVSKRYLDDVIAAIDVSGAPVVLPEWMGGVYHTGAVGSKSLVIRKPSGTTAFAVKDVDDPVDPTDVSNKKYVDNLSTTGLAFASEISKDYANLLESKIDKKRAAQQAADRIASFKWSLTRVGTTSDFTFTMNVKAVSTLSYLNLKTATYQIAVDELVVVSGVRTGALVRLYENKSIPAVDISSGEYTFTQTLNLGATTPPITSGTAPLLLTISPEINCTFETPNPGGEASTTIYPTRFQVGRGSGLNGTVIVAA